MAYLRISEARAVGRAVSSTLQKRAGLILTEDAEGFSTERRYDIFLSHAYDDGDAILGVRWLIEDQGLTVYVDWIDDPNLDRSRVTSGTAAVLRTRMHACSSLIYAHSPNSANSAWMPWEVGFFDGYKPHHVWILPLVADFDTEFTNREYLGLYPKVENLSSLPGRANLGFHNVKIGNDRRQVLLAEAARGSGIFTSSE